MKRLFLGLLSASILFSLSQAPAAASSLPNDNEKETGSAVELSEFSPENRTIRAQQNLIGEVTAVDPAAGRITVKTEAGAAVTVSFNEKTAFRRVMPGQTSIADAEQITVAEVTIGDRVLIPGGSPEGQTAVRQIIVMPRAAISAQRNQELEARRARTVNGRVTAVNPQNREIIIQARGAGGAQTLTVSAPENAKLLRYAPDSLKISDAVAGSLADVQVGDQIRIVGDRNAEGTRVTAEEIVSGSFTRTVGSIVEINAARREVTVKNNQTGQTMTVTVGQNTSLRRIPDEVADNLRQRASRREERQRERNNRQNTANPQTQQQPGQEANRQNRGENRRRNGAGRQGQPGAGNRGGLFENLPTVTLSELKPGDAILITGSRGTDNARMTAVSIITGDPALQQILQRTGGGRNNQPGSPGLPGNVSGGNSVGDPDEPRR